MARLAAFALVVRLVIDLATPWLPGAFVLHVDGFSGVTAAHGESSAGTSSRARAPANARASTTATVVTSPPLVVVAAPPRRHVSHPLRLPAEGLPASAERSADH